MRAHISQAAGNLVLRIKGGKEALTFRGSGKLWSGPGCPTHPQDQETGEEMLAPEGQPRASQMLAASPIAEVTEQLGHGDMALACTVSKTMGAGPQPSGGWTLLPRVDGIMDNCTAELRTPESGPAEHTVPFLSPSALDSG